MLAYFILSIFKLYNKSFIWNNPDGTLQHIVNLQYFRSLLINFIKTGQISTFTWNIGLGMDMFANIAYYAIGDIFSYFAIFFPTKLIEDVYTLLVITRMYFVGIAFIYYCKYKKINILGSLIGALMYTFSFYVLYASVRHPYFTNAAILFPLIIMGIEKMILEDKHLFYTIIIAITFISSFYFGYMMALIIAIYGITLAINTYKKDGYRKIIRILLKTLLYSFIGIIISAIILLPAGIGFLNSERTALNTIYPYTENHYRVIISSLLSNQNSGYWLCWGTQSIIFLTLPAFIRRRKDNYSLFLTLLILLVPIFISQVGSIFSGFSFPNNRWSFVFNFIFAFITTLYINNHCKIEKQDIFGAAIFSLLYFGINYLFDISLTTYEEFQILILIIIMLLIANKKVFDKKYKKISLFALSLLLTFITGIFATINNIYQEKNYASEFLNKNELSNVYNTSLYSINDFNKAIRFIEKNDKEYYRIIKYPYKYENLPLIKKYNALGYYYSITPNLSAKLNYDLANSQYYINYNSKEFDYRTKITTLLGAKYYIAGNDNNSVPYGYNLINKYKEESKVYINKYFLPFAILYTNYIDESYFNKLNSLQKENAFLKVTALQNPNKKLETNKNLNLDKNIQNKKYILKDTNNIFTDKNKLIVTKTQKNSFQINIKEIKNSELYITFDNLVYKPFSKNDKIDQEIKRESTKKQIKDIKDKYKWYQPSNSYVITTKFGKISKYKSIRDYYSSPYYMDTSNIIINLGYYNQTSGDITITLSKIGHYTFDDIKVYAVSMDDYEQDINNLRRSNFKLKDYGNGYLNGTVDCEENGVLQFSTLYTKGWKVYVDGKLTENFKTNKYFLGINIEKGEHTISLKYHNPYLKYGAILSAIGIISLVILTKNNKNKQK